jgi:chorismate-pyruvate lyase
MLKGALLGMSTSDFFPLLLVDESLNQHEFAQFTLISPADIPEPYRRLLVHHHHMTVTLEEFNHDNVDVVVLSILQAEQSYQREILLKTQQSKKIVQFGLVRINLNYCSPEVRAEILAEKTPLGRILINHNVLRRIEPTAFLLIQPQTRLIEYLRLERSIPLYGRMGVIFCDNQPAIAVAEILTPIDP